MDFLEDWNEDLKYSIPLFCTIGYSEVVAAGERHLLSTWSTSDALCVGGEAGV